MRKSIGVKPCIYPMPVLIIGSYDEEGNADAMNAAWGGITGGREITLCLSSGHKTVKNILKTKAFTVSFADKDHMTACDYVGIESGNNVPDKMKKAGFTTTKSERVNAPVINELPLCLECMMKDYDETTEHMTGIIVDVNADERVLTNGQVDIQKVAPITFDGFNSAYHVIGEKVGNAFSDGGKLK